jgi:hypothetical protein
VTRRTAGREDPRVTRTRSVVLDAAATLLAERGYAAFTMDALPPSVRWPPTPPSPTPVTSATT